MTKGKPLNKLLKGIRQSNAILTNGSDFIAGFFYERETMEAPVLSFKNSKGLNDYVLKVAGFHSVKYMKSEKCTEKLLSKTKRGDYVPEDIFRALAKVLAREFVSAESADFKKRLEKDIFTQLYKTEERTYKCAEKRYFRQTKEEGKNRADVCSFIKNKIKKLAAEYDYDYKHIHKKSSVDEFYLEPKSEEADFDFWQMVHVSIPEQKIYVGNRSVLRCFDIKDADYAVGYLTALMGCKEDLIKDIKTYRDEFEITPKLYEIAKSSIKTILEVNCTKNGILYSLDYDKTASTIYLQNRENSDFAYVIVITHKEFMRNPEAFKKIIAEPKVFVKWNFWCKEEKYDKGLFYAG